MSRNNVIVVACDKRQKRFKYYVLANICADNDWDLNAVKFRIDRFDLKWTYSRSKALCRGHNIQKKIDTEYGVRELDVK